MDEVAHWLARWREGDETAITRLLPHIYADLRELALREQIGRGDSPSLRPTELVHEVCLRLLGKIDSKFDSVAHLLNTAARMMRQIRINRAQAAAAIKRGGDLHRIEFDELAAPVVDADDDAQALDEALGELERSDARAAQVVELHYFAGLGVGEISSVLDLSKRTVDRDLLAARTWLRRRLTRNR